jgi:hypothetical protein
MARYSPVVSQPVPVERQTGASKIERKGRYRLLEDRHWRSIHLRLTALHDETRLPLTLEHVHGELPVNGDWRKDGRFGSQPWGSRRLNILAHTDVYRTYDVTSILSLPTTLDRVAEMLKGAEGRPEVSGLLNVEDEVYVAAVLGCTMGLLRHPLEDMRPGPDAKLFFNGPRRAKRRMDEVVRALRWQRLAQPFSPGSGTVKVSEDVLTDSWRFERTQTWQNDLIGPTVRQGHLHASHGILIFLTCRARERNPSSLQHVFLMER